MLRSALAWLRRIGFDYSCFVIYSLPLAEAAPGRRAKLPSNYRIAEVSAGDLEGSSYPELRDCQSYLGADALVFGVFSSDDVLVCAQCMWYGDRYRKVRFWPLATDEAVSMHLISVDAERRKGLATCLKEESAERMRKRGFSRLYSRIWWTNRASRRVSEKAGWTQVGTVLEVKLPGRQRPLRFVRRQLHRAGIRRYDDRRDGVGIASLTEGGVVPKTGLSVISKPEVRAVL